MSTNEKEIRGKPISEATDRELLEIIYTHVLHIHEHLNWLESDKNREGKE